MSSVVLKLTSLLVKTLSKPIAVSIYSQDSVFQLKEWSEPDQGSGAGA